MTGSDGSILITGGTGKTGRRIAQRLEADGISVRIGSRSGRPPFDWEDRATWAPALDGATAAYLSCFPDLAVPGAAETVGEFAELAVAGGVRRLVLLSGRGEEEAGRAERIVQAAGADWTVVRSAFFAQNFSESFLLGPILAGEVALPVDGMPEPFVDVEDVADVAAAALTEDGHAGRVHEVTGPRLLTFADAVAEVAEAAGRPVRYQAVPVAPWAAELAGHGLPPELVGLMTYLFTEVMDGRNAQLAGGVQQALGRPPRDFGEYARRAAAEGAWAGVPAGR